MLWYNEYVDEMNAYQDMLMLRVSDLYNFGVWQCLTKFLEVNWLLKHIIWLSFDGLKFTLFSHSNQIRFAQIELHFTRIWIPTHSL